LRTGLPLGLLVGLLVGLPVAGCRAGPDPAAGGPVPPPAAGEPGRSADAPVVGVPAGATVPPSGGSPTIPVVPTAEAPPATSTPAGPLLRRLTEPGCCPAPFWRADGQRVLYWSGPPDDAPGIWGVPLAGGEPSREGDLPAGVQRLGAFESTMEGDTAVLTRRADGRVWRVAAGGEGLLVSHDLRRAAWANETRRSVPGQRPPPLRHHVLDLATEAAREVEAPPLYALVDWTADGAWTMLQTDRRPEEPALIRFDPDSGELQPLLTGRRLRTLRPSPDGRWLAVTRSMEADPAANGLWLVATDGSAPPRALSLFGGYRWRDGGRLLVVPQEPGAASMRLVEVAAATGATRPLGDPATLPFRIAAGEWSVSPDGRHVAFRSAGDGAIWVIDLPD
jgi:hypothetical protein